MTVSVKIPSIEKSGHHYIPTLIRQAEQFCFGVAPLNTIHDGIRVAK